MTKEEIVRFAKESGWQVDPEGNIFDADGWHTCTDEVERFAALVIAAERQRKAWNAEYWTAYEHDVAAAERDRLISAAERCIVCEQRRIRHEATTKNETNL